MKFKRKQPRYIVGIDLGTTNTVVAYTEAVHHDNSSGRKEQSDLYETKDKFSTDKSSIFCRKAVGGSPDQPHDRYSDMSASHRVGNMVQSGTENEYPEIKLFRILQFTGTKALEKRDALPSFLYMMQQDESLDSGLKLPWEESNNTLVAGEFARERGVELAHRLVSSSKSWLCNDNVDRNSPILPFEMQIKGEKDKSQYENQSKISPVEATCAILSHIKNAWNYEMAKDNPQLKLENQAIYLTVPASFDAVARQLTVKAAELAGIENPVLIEEPQAAFYSWINRSGDKWRKTIKKGDLVLVCDIGGGTSDFSLIEVKEGEKGNLELERLAVGDHLLVGGDNIDLALTYFIKAELEKKGKKLDAWQMRALVHSSRKAKENLCSVDGKDKYPVTILGRGRGLIKGTIKTKLQYKDIETILFNGFFPECHISDKPRRSTNAGIKEFGLAYESDPGITRHLAKFISSCVDENGKTRLPTAVVFNGGVMKSSVLRTRLMDIIRSWAEDSEIKHEIKEIRDHVDFDFSVAKGAACYGLAVKGKGIRIRSGLGKSYYMAVEAAMPAIPGFFPPTRALCIAPFGMEEGSEAQCRDQVFNLVVGHEVNFDIMTSSVRKQDAIGVLIDNWEEKEINELSSIGTVLQGESDTLIPVTFKVKLTETGTLEFWAYEKNGEKKWKFELNIRSNTAGFDDT